MPRYLQHILQHGLQRCAMIPVALACLLSSVALRAAEPQSLFNGKDLSGWSGNKDLWSVKDGAIVGTTVGKNIPGNTFLVWDGGEVSDFKLTLEARVEGNNNSGVQYRSTLADPKTYRVIGYQADIHAAPANVGMLYGEGLGRGIIAQRGAKVVVDAKSGKPKVVGKTCEVTPIDISKWHEYTVIARGNHLIHLIDGEVATVITDNHADKLSRGILALQIHRGPDMTAFFRNIKLETLDASSEADQTGAVDLLPDGAFAEHWNTKGNWKTQKGGFVSLVPRPGEKGWSRFDAYLWSKKQYGDFEIEVEFMLDPHGNSGFYFNVGDVKDPVRKGIEVQIYDSYSKKAGDKLTDHDCGGVIPGLPPSKRASKAPGEWDKFNIRSQGGKLTVKLNGQVVNKVDLSDPRLQGRPAKGYIGFQDHGLPLKLRNIRIREL